MEIINSLLLVREVFIFYIFHIVLYLWLLRCGRVYRLLSEWTGSPVTAITWFWRSDLQKTQHVRSVNRTIALMTFPSWNLVVSSNTWIFYQSRETPVAECLLPSLQPANWKNTLLDIFTENSAIPTLKTLGTLSF